MKAFEPVTLPACPHVERWRPSVGAIGPLQAAAELIDVAERMPPGADGEAFRRAVTLAIECMGAFHPELAGAVETPDMVLGGPYRRMVVPGKMIASARAFARAHCERKEGATVKLKALFDPWHERWIAAGNAKTRADLFFSALEAEFAGITKHCRGDGNWVAGLRLKAAPVEADDADDAPPKTTRETTRTRVDPRDANATARAFHAERPGLSWHQHHFIEALESGNSQTIATEGLDAALYRWLDGALDAKTSKPIRPNKRIVVAIRGSLQWLLSVGALHPGRSAR